MSQFASGAGGAAGLGPWGALAGAGVGLLGGIIGGNSAKKAQKKAEMENRRRYAQMLDLLRTSGEATKTDIRSGAVGERAQATQSAAGRGLYNSSVLDTLQSQANDREARAMAQVDQNTADKTVGVIGDRVDAYPDTGPAMNAMQIAGATLPGLIQGFGGLFGKSARPATQPTDTVGGVAKIAGATVPGAAPLAGAAGALSGYGAVAPAVQQGASNVIKRLSRGVSWMRPQGYASMLGV
jgi:hypothetical protein